MRDDFYHERLRHATLQAESIVSAGDIPVGMVFSDIYGWHFPEDAKRAECWAQTPAENALASLAAEFSAVRAPLEQRIMELEHILDDMPYETTAELMQRVSALTSALRETLVWVRGAAESDASVEGHKNIRCAESVIGRALDGSYNAALAGATKEDSGG
jgi:hypothetical protein